MLLKVCFGRTREGRVPQPELQLLAQNRPVMANAPRPEQPVSLAPISRNLLSQHLPAAPVRRREAEMAFEGAAESGFGFVAGLVGDALHRGVRRLQALCGKLPAPIGQVMHGGYIEKMLEAPGQHRAWHADPACQPIHGPVLQRSMSCSA